MTRESSIEQGNLLGRLLNRPSFTWPGERPTTFGEKIAALSEEEAKKRLSTLRQETDLSPVNVVQKVLPRAKSWQFESLLDHFVLKRQ